MLKTDVVLEVKHITKRFPGVLANDDVSIQLHRGEILALLGENGAGKSTLMNIIYGLYHPDEGTIELGGREVRFASPREAIYNGIGMVHQHFQLIPVMSVAENVILGEEKTTTDVSAADASQTQVMIAQRLSARGTPLVRALRVGWGVVWRSLSPLMAILLGILSGFIAYLVVLTLSTYLVQSSEFQGSRFTRQPLEDRAVAVLQVYYPTNPTVTRILLWLPILVGSVVGALSMVSIYRHVRKTWRGAEARTADEKLAPLDSILDALVDLFGTTGRLISRARAAKRVRELSKRFGLEVDPEALVEKLPVGIQQRVEIVKALYRKADILILDEPTAVLTPQESKELFRIMKELTLQGVSIIFITHKLKEVLEVADNIVVMRNGRVVGSATPSESTQESLAALMVGRDVLLRVSKDEARPKEIVLAVRDLQAIDDRGAVALDQVSFEVRGGEVLGIAGVQGNGQTELVEVLTGLRKPLHGEIRIYNELVPFGDPRIVTDSGVAHIPEDRQRYGMVKPFSVADNLVLNSYYRAPVASFPSLRQFPLVFGLYLAVFSVLAFILATLWSQIYPSLVESLDLANLRPRETPGPFIVALFISLAVASIGLLACHFTAVGVVRMLRGLFRTDRGGLQMSEREVERIAMGLVDEYDIRTPSVQVNAGNLSGGNQQKMVVAREFSRKPQVLIASQPTRGIDVGSIEFIHQRIIQQRDAGAAVLLVSAELDEIMALSDRIAVMYKGQIIAILGAQEATREELGLLMAGIQRELA
ncbi:MAG: hypothetical protein OHK0023_18640 [Anaerolineae bacterium]